MLRRSLRRLADSLGTPLRLSRAPEFLGPTDVNAQSGNQRLSVGINRAGTITVLRWPRPSYYNQVGHHTTDRDAPRYGAHPNEGAFLGLVVTVAGGARAGAGETTWLRDWDHAQAYDDDGTDAVVTTYRHDGYGLVVRVVDVVAADADVLLREVTVDRAADSSVETASLLAYANLDPTVSKRPWTPTQDLVRRRDDRSLARYHTDVSAVVFSKAGVDESTDRVERVAVAVGFDAPCDGFDVGGDAHHPGGTGAGVQPQDAYDVASTGVLRGNRSHRGQSTAALARRLDFAAGAGREEGGGEGHEGATGGGTGGASITATATVFVAAAPTVAAVRDRLAAARGWDAVAVRAAKRAWFDDLLREAPLPATDDPVIRRVARRALVTLVTNYDPVSGAVVASIATRSPYAQDWPRDGAFCNHVLDRIGRSDWVRKRNRWYASLQERSGRRLLGRAVIPAGNWTMNYYADGVAGGPIPWEIDQTALAVWTLWDHYHTTGGTDYLREVYPAIRRAADFLAGFRDPTTGLHRAAHEDDNVVRSRTVVGASAVWLALDSAARAARVLDEAADHARYRRRRDELAAAIETHLWRPGEGAYRRGPSLLHALFEHPRVPDVVRALPILPGTRGVTTLVWPASFADVDGPRMRRHLDHVWASVAPSFAEPAAGRRSFGMYETKALAALARAWRGRPDVAKVRAGVRWVAHQHATPDTGVLGEAWVRRGGRVRSAVSQPHTFTGLLFYDASLEAFPPDDPDPADGGRRRD